MEKLSQVARIAGGRVVSELPGGEFGEIGVADVLVDGARVADATGEGLVVDARGCLVIPGMIDLHFHGAMGADLCDGTPEALATMTAYEASRGVTAVCPASMTLPEGVLAAAFTNAAAFEPGPAEAALVGINMEGPYISPSKVGAQNPAYVRPADAGEFARLQAAARGLVRLVDVAPEEPGNLEFVGAVAGEVRVSLAHTCADYDCARAAFAAGARHMTHLFNAMPPLHHRLPGPIAAAAETPGITAEIITDGIHVHPAMVRLAFELFGAERMILISDTLRAVGLGDGTYDLGGQDVCVCGREARIADGSLAGSVSDLATCLSCSVREMGIPLADAVRAATLNPARALGVDAERGSLAPGKIADAVVLDEDLRVKHVILRGRLLR